MTSWGIKPQTATAAKSARTEKSFTFHSVRFSKNTNRIMAPMYMDRATIRYEISRGSLPKISHTSSIRLAVCAEPKTPIRLTMAYTPMNPPQAAIR